MKKKNNNDLILVESIKSDKKYYFTTVNRAGKFLGLQSNSVNWAIVHKNIIFFVDGNEQVTISIVDGSEIPYKYINHDVIDEYVDENVDENECETIYNDGKNEVVYLLNEDRVVICTGFDDEVCYYDYELNKNEDELRKCFKHIMNIIPQKADYIYENIHSLLNKQTNK